MKTTVGKVLSVVIAVASVIFLGFVLIATMGGPNWVADAHSVDGFTFARTDANPPMWTATPHVGNANISSNSAIEPVLLAVYDAKLNSANAEKSKFDKLDSPLQAAIDESEAAIKTDLAALEKLVKDDLAALLEQTEIEVLNKANEVEAKAEEVRKIELQIQSRRDDVLRLQAQVEEIRADRFAIRAVQHQIQDLIQQIDGSLERAENRRSQLESRTSSQGAARPAKPAPAGKS